MIASSVYEKNKVADQQLCTTQADWCLDFAAFIATLKALAAHFISFWGIPQLFKVSPC